jgi:CO dehydrogenase nickel-insertion accessory protein CooC1
LIARGLAAHGRTLAVDCDPNPNLAESFGFDSSKLDRFSHGDLARSGPTLVLAREPALLEAEPSLWLLGGPPSSTPAADAVARGIAGVLLSHRFEAVVTDLGAGPELAGVAVGGILNPADVCVILADGTLVAEATADRIEAVCRARGVPSVQIANRRGAADAVAAELVEYVRTALT